MGTEHVVGILMAALKELEEFSIPGVGTFVRMRRNAQIRTDKKIIFPPVSTIQIKKGQTRLNRFYDFLVQHYHISRQEAQAVAKALGEYMQKYLDSIGSIELEGLGVIKKSAGAYKFDNQKSLFTYGLMPVSAVPVKVTERQAASFATLVGEKPKRRIRVATILFIVLILGALGTLGYFFKDKIFKTKKETSKPESVVERVETPKQITSPTPQKEQTKTEKKAEKPATAQEQKPKQQTTTTTEEAPKPQFVYHVIVSSAKGAKRANREVRRWKQKGYNAKKIKHPTKAGWYRISVLQTTDKNKALELQKQLSSEVEGVWIYKEKKD